MNGIKFRKKERKWKTNMARKRNTHRVTKSNSPSHWVPANPWCSRIGDARRNPHNSHRKSEMRTLGTLWAYPPRQQGQPWAAPHTQTRHGNSNQPLRSQLIGMLCVGGGGIVMRRDAYTDCNSMINHQHWRIIQLITRWMQACIRRVCGGQIKLLFLSVLLGKAH